MQPVKRPKTIDLTIQSPVAPVTPINRNNILAGAYNVLNNVPSAIKNPSNPSPTNRNNTNSTNTNTSTTPQNSKPSKPSNPHSFTSGVVDYVSFHYDANRIKNADYHTKFATQFGEQILHSTSTSQPLNPYKILCENSEHKNNNNNPITDYSQYNIFGTDTNNNPKQSIVSALFHPNSEHGIKDTKLFNHISTNILKLKIVGDVGIDILNFLHALFIILYWNDRYFKLSLNEAAMHGIIKMLEALVPLQTCVWWLNLQHSLNQTNQTNSLPNVDFKNILNKQSEKVIFYANLIKRLMSSGEEQSNTWKDYLFHSQSNLNTFLWDERKRRLHHLSGDTAESESESDSSSNVQTAFNKQLRNYIDQLLLPKLILNCQAMTDSLKETLQSQNRLNLKCLKSREYLAKNVCSYFSENESVSERAMNSSNSESESYSVSFTENETENETVYSERQSQSGLMYGVNAQLSSLLYSELQKQASVDRNKNIKPKKKKGYKASLKKHQKHRKRHKRHKRRADSSEAYTSSEEEESDPKQSNQKKRKYKRKMSEESESEYLKKKKRKIETETEAKMQKPKRSSDDNNNNKSESVSLKNGNICMDFETCEIDKFLKCGICKEVLGDEILTINECMDSFCQTCLERYLEKCVRSGKKESVKCPSCDYDLGQGSVSSIREKMCKEDKLKMSLIELIKKTKKSTSDAVI